jgi:enoyl-CoA hydratase/carnithine racemase
MTAAAMFALPEVTAGSLSPHGGAQSLARAPRWRIVHLLATATEEGRDQSSVSGILADTAYGLLTAGPAGG